jgi:hypothetical protein
MKCKTSFSRMWCMSLPIQPAEVMCFDIGIVFRPPYVLQLDHYRSPCRFVLEPSRVSDGYCSWPSRKTVQSGVVARSSKTLSGSVPRSRRQVSSSNSTCSAISFAARRYAISLPGGMSASFIGFPLRGAARKGLTGPCREVGNAKNLKQRSRPVKFRQVLSFRC